MADSVSFSYSATNDRVQCNMTTDMDTEDHVNSSIDFNDIPIDSQLEIFSYLDIKSLCRASQVCTPWATLTEDNLFWDARLKHDSYTWEVIDYLYHPETCRESCPDLTPKEIYIRSCPEYRTFEEQNRTYLPQLSRIRHYFGFSVIPRVMIFGSGLDNSGLITRIMIGDNSPFTVGGAFPSQFNGIGSGVTLKHADGAIDMIALYGLPKYERENPNSTAQSKLLSGNPEAPDGEKSLIEPVKQLCSTITSFVYVIDGTEDEKVNRVEEFHTMIDDRWCEAKSRVLVLCVVPDAVTPSVASLRIANMLNLPSLSRPWQVRQCRVDSLHGFLPGLKWVTAHV